MAGTHLKVIEYIKQEIRSGNLKLGSCLPPERTLAEKLDVSRNSVREAIRVMEVMGTIESTQGAGHFIASNFESSIVESMSLMFILNGMNTDSVSQLRKALEREALILAIENADEKDLDALDQIASQLDIGIRGESENVALDKRLHYSIAKASQNILILDILEALSEVMDRFIADMRSDIMADEERKNMLTGAHRRMVNAIKNKDMESGLKAFEEHFRLIDSSIEMRKTTK